jgi:hypothetical protein
MVALHGSLLHFESDWSEKIPNLLNRNAIVLAAVSYSGFHDNYIWMKYWRNKLLPSQPPLRLLPEYDNIANTAHNEKKLDELDKLKIEFEKNKDERCLYRIGVVICPIVFVLCMFFIPTPGPEQQAAVLFYGGFFTALLYGTLRSFLGVFCENCTCNKRRISILKRKIQYLKTVSFEK